MSVKLIGAAIVIAGGIGAGASYLQSNPGALAEFGPQTLAFRGPLASPTGSDGNYVPGKYYRLCRNEYANNMRRMTQIERRDACKCFDRLFQTWSPALQNAAKLAMHGAIALSHVPKNFEITERFNDGKRRKLSAHERSVLESQLRDQHGSIRRSYNEGLNRKTVEEARANPVTTALATARLAALAKRCGIIDKSFDMPGMNSAF